jgi:hypothetical protein
MDSRRFRIALVIFAFVTALAFTSCSQPPQPSGEAKSGAPAKEAALPAGPVTGKTALWEMAKSAHNWARDMTPLTLKSGSISGVKNEAGKAPLWTATFGSPSKHEARTFTFATVSSPDVTKGVTIGKGIPWAGPTSDVMPFEANEVTVDSDAAVKTASESAAKWLKQHPDKEPAITLGNASRFPAAVWYVYWGDKNAAYALFVNSKTGELQK